MKDSDTELSEKITEILNIYEKNPNFKGKPSFKKWFNYCRRYGHSVVDCRQKQSDNRNKPQKCRETNKSSHQYKKNDQKLPNKNIHSNNSSGKPLLNNSNYHRQQPPNTIIRHIITIKTTITRHNTNYRGRSPIKEIHENQ